MEAFAARLRRLREARGLSQYRLAQLSGISKEGVSKLEEEGSDPKLSTLAKLAGALGLHLRDLIGGEVVNSSGPTTAVNSSGPPAPSAVDEFRRVCLPYLQSLFVLADVNQCMYSGGTAKSELFRLKEDVIDPSKGQSTEVDHIIAALTPALRDLRKFHAQKPMSSIEYCNPRYAVVPLLNQMFQAIGVEPSKMTEEEMKEHVRQSTQRRQQTLARRATKGKETKRQRKEADQEDEKQREEEAHPVLDDYLNDLVWRLQQDAQRLQEIDRKVREQWCRSNLGLVKRLAMACNALVQLLDG